MAKKLKGFFKFDEKLEILSDYAKKIADLELIIPDNNKILESVKSYIENHLSESIEIEQLCNKFDVGRTKLYEIFRKEQKMGISKYILRRRLHKAKKLLKTTELSIAEIANNVGFSDYNYFSRIHKKQYGKSPKYYRRK